MLFPTGLKHDRKNLRLLVWPAGFVIYLTARFCPFIAEYVYARGLYRAYGLIMSLITGWIPISLAEWLLILVPAGFVIMIVVSVIRLIIIDKARSVRALNLLRRIIVIPGIIFLWFMIGAGTNYYRYEFSSFSGLEIRESTVDELYDLCTDLAVKAVYAREEAVLESLEQEENEYTDGSLSAFLYGSQDTPYRSSYDDHERGRLARLAMKKLGESYPVMKGYYPYYKPVFFSRVMSEFNITGVYFPWTMEANVDVDIPDYSIGATACHELSHLRGFMREDEANFIGYLACKGSESAELRYSGYMLALIYAGNRLYEDSPELYRRLIGYYSEGMLTDLKDNNAYWKQFEDTVYSEAGEKMNDTYLKANNQTDGTRSYGRMVDLLLAEKRKNDHAE